MRRTGYNSLGSSQEAEDGVEETDGRLDDVEEAKPFTEFSSIDGKSYRKTLCLVFTLFFGGFVSFVTKRSLGGPR